jgi:hypothetical protein
MIDREQRSNNRVTALVLASIALALFIAIMLKYVLIK